MLFFRWPQILTEFTTKESYTFDSQYTVLFKTIYTRVFQKHLFQKYY